MHALQPLGPPLAEGLPCWRLTSPCHLVADAQGWRPSIPNLHAAALRAQTKFERMRKVFIGAEQGLRTLLERLLVALGEMEPGAARAARVQATLSGLPMSNKPGHQSSGTSVTGRHLCVSACCAGKRMHVSPVAADLPCHASAHTLHAVLLRGRTPTAAFIALAPAGYNLDPNRRNAPAGWRRPPSAGSASQTLSAGRPANAAYDPKGARCVKEGGDYGVLRELGCLYNRHRSKG